MDVLTTLRCNVDRVEARIADACARASRARSEVTLVGVTKYVDVATARLLVHCGVHVLGESRPQVLWEKAEAIPEAEWHLVGHLQRNKVARTLPLARLIHSVDSMRLLGAIDEEASKRGVVQDVLLEVHLTSEVSKHGFTVAEWSSVPDQLVGRKHVRIRGLMTMAALDSSLSEASNTFAALRNLRDEARQRFAPPHDLSELSMGMTHDFEAAIAEGATLVRIGSALFEGLPGST